MMNERGWPTSFVLQAGGAGGTCDALMPFVPPSVGDVHVSAVENERHHRVFVGVLRSPHQRSHAEQAYDHEDMTCG
jgi:hypothetical protein